MVMMARSGPNCTCEIRARRRACRPPRRHGRSFACVGGRRPGDV